MPVTYETLRPTAYAIIPDVGRATFAKSIAMRRLFLAIGIGDPAWDEPGVILPSMKDATGLHAEIGRRAVSSCNFVVVDPEGDIVVPGGIGSDGKVLEARYRQVPHPTPYLCLRTNFDYSDARGSTLREIALYADTVIKPGLPEGQRYFTPADIAEQGDLIAVQILPDNLNRTYAVRQTNEWVLLI